MHESVMFACPPASPAAMRHFVSILIIVLLIAGCGSDQPTPQQNAAATAAAREADAAKQAGLYEQMRGSGSWDVAVSLGGEILDQYPGTRAAAQVQQSIADAREHARANSESRRLAALWNYTATPEAGGTQYAAAIATQAPLAPQVRLRLVLRQHPQWGRSVYLLLDNARFDCSGGCASLPVAFDDAKAQRMKATVPPTGEPALFIDDDKAFIARMEKSRSVSIQVRLKGEGDKTATFEVGGFSSARWLPAQH